MSKDGKVQEPEGFEPGMMHRPESGATREDVLEAFMREGLAAAPERVRAWIARHPEFRVDLLRLASHLALGTIRGVSRTVSIVEKAAMRRRAVERSRELASGEDGCSRHGSQPGDGTTR